MMSLVDQIPKLSERHVTKLHNTLIEAGIAHTSGSNEWREIFRKSKNTHKGLQGRIYDSLYHASWSDIDKLVRGLTEK